MNKLNFMFWNFILRESTRIIAFPTYTCGIRLSRGTLLARAVYCAAHHLHVLLITCTRYWCCVRERSRQYWNDVTVAVPMLPGNMWTSKCKGAGKYMLVYPIGQNIRKVWLHLRKLLVYQIMDDIDAHESERFNCKARDYFWTWFSVILKQFSYASQGLRTLVFAMREITPEDFERINQLMVRVCNFRPQYYSFLFLKLNN